MEKGNMIDTIIQNFFEPGFDYIIFGAGNTCHEFAQEYIKVKYIVDNDKKKQSHFLNGLEVRSPKSLLDQQSKVKVIIGSTVFYQQMRRELEKMGFQFNKNCFYYRDLVSILSWARKKGRLYNEVEQLIKK